MPILPAGAGGGSRGVLWCAGALNSSFLLLVAMPFVPSSFLLLVVMPGATGCVEMC